MIPELKPCPHCGGRAAFQDFDSARGACWTVICVNEEVECCIARSGTGTFARKTEAAAAWNARVTPELTHVGYLKDVGTKEDPCYVGCAKGDPGAFAVYREA